MPDQFPNHERRLYIFGCRAKPCRRKEGSIRAIRSIRLSIAVSKHPPRNTGRTASDLEPDPVTPSEKLGDRLFATKSPTFVASNPNPFSTAFNSISNPFSSTPLANPPCSSQKMLPSFDVLASKAPQRPNDDDLPATFAQKVRISASPAAPEPLTLQEPWPVESELPRAYHMCHLDADFESLESPSQKFPIPQNMNVDGSENQSTVESDGNDDADIFESTIDKTFQRFADRLSQNPLQVLRYEFMGTPLLYAKTDQVGKILVSNQSVPQTDLKKIITVNKGRMSGIPRCGNCGAGRAFEMQLTPQAIAELEADETGIEGMDWGTILLGVCKEDCQAQRVKQGEVGHLEEWIGVQWEELTVGRR